ncbi:hypothetical protein THRCLA_03297, partial [Thraustotheca clavata]
LKTAVFAKEDFIEMDRMMMDMDTVHRPLLFESKGYASSQLLLDDANWQKRRPEKDKYLQGPSTPLIRLETLTSMTATIVLGISYLAFCVAFALPYLYSTAYMQTKISLPGDVCTPKTSIDTPCTYIDYHTANAWYAANVSNVSWFAGSMQLGIDVSHLEQHEQTYVLEYDVYVYGGQFPFGRQSRHKPIFTIVNQTVWLLCSRNSSCDHQVLFDIAQVNEGLGGNGYGSYLILLVYHDYYPHLFAKKVQYAFSYTKPIVFFGQLLTRTLLLVGTLISILYWYRAIPNMLRSQRQIVFILLVLTLWQNPVYVIAQWFGDVSSSVRLSANFVQAWAGALFRGLWIFIMEHPASPKAGKQWPKYNFMIIFGVMQTMQSLLRDPTLGHEPEVETAYIILGVGLIFLNWYWLRWMVDVCFETTAVLKTFSYMSTRHDQLSFRFLCFESLLLLLDIFLLSVVQVFRLFSVVMSKEASSSVEKLRRACVMVLGTTANDIPLLSFVVFFAILVALTMWVHQPAPSIESTSLLFRSTAFYVQEAHQRDIDSHVFCLETAEWLVQLAWQAYFDPLGNPSASGAGVQSIENYGFELVAHLRHELLDTHAIVCLNLKKMQLVVAFRGSVSKAHWKTNMRFHQVPIYIESMQNQRRNRRRNRSWRERFEFCAARIPLINQALPRVHSGFWKAYAAVRHELKETLHLLFQEHSDLSVYITGHSMGGALAICAAYDCAVHFNIPNIHMYNFGGPRVGNPAFVRQYNNKVPNSFRIVFDGDLVAGIPRFWGLYEHVGSEVAIDDAGNVIVDPSFVERRLLVSSKTKVASHATLVYRTGLRNCMDNLLF